MGDQMGDIFFNNLDKLVLQLVLELEQLSHCKEHEKQQIQMYTANIVGKKVEICQLKEDIKQNSEVIISLQKQHTTIKDNCSRWKPTYMVLNKHKAYLQKELQNVEETTEKDKKMYQDSMTQCQQTFKQHQAKYLETASVKEYYRQKKELEKIQYRVLKLSELYHEKETELMHLQETGPFHSLSSWALQIASLRQNTKETLRHAEGLKQQSFELDRTAELLEKRKNHFKQQLEKTAENEKNPEVAEGENAKNNEKKSFDERENQHENEKLQIYKSLHLSSVSKQLVQNISTINLLFEPTNTGMKDKEDSTKHSTVHSIYFRHENEKKCTDSAGADITKPAQLPFVSGLQNQSPFRLLTYQKHISSIPWSKTEAKKIAEKDDKGQEGDASKDSSCVSQDMPGESYVKSADRHSAARGENPEKLPTSEPNILPKTPDTNGRELILPESEGSLTKSPFNILAGFTAKSPGFSFFDSPGFGAEFSVDQPAECFSSGNLNSVSPHNALDLFEKMDHQDSFSFSFPSCSSVQAFQDGKDDFSFPFAFGSSATGSVKGFQSSLQNGKPFSLF